MSFIFKYKNVFKKKPSKNENLPTSVMRAINMNIKVRKFFTLKR